MSTELEEHKQFSWSDLGDPATGRPNLGLSLPVSVYRLLQYTLRDVLVTEFDADTADTIFFKAGKLAGEQFCRNMLNTDLEFNEFVAELQTVLREQKVGVLRVEQADLDNMHLVLAVAEDLDCSGLPCTDETVCVYDEGFISGILGVYTGKEFQVKEIDCWASGDRVCRFDAKLTGE
jgi:predicted hydrocarbon binding protein